jgi:hypothetical protein
MPTNQNDIIRLVKDSLASPFIGKHLSEIDVKEVSALYQRQIQNLLGIDSGVEVTIGIDASGNAQVSISWPSRTEVTFGVRDSLAPPEKRSCNRHFDCDEAEAKALARNPGMKKIDIGFNFHCHDDECEDCFGS